MTPEQFKEEMQILSIYEEDKEAMHAYMDDLLCQVLRDLGYEDGIEIFEEADKWYA